MLARSLRTRKSYFLLFQVCRERISSQSHGICSPGLNDAAVGAFTPGCSVRHLPGFIDHLSEIKSKGVDVVAVIAFNDAWVMSAWAKANKIKDEIVGFPSVSPHVC